MDRNMDLIVIGAGPAGLSAACAARACGLDVTLVDEQAAPGGQLFRNIEAPMAQALLDPKERAAGLGLVKRFRESGATYYPGTTVWGLEPHRVSCTMNGKAEELAASHIIVAPGGMERPVPFPGWTLPGAPAARSPPTRTPRSSLRATAPCSSCLPGTCSKRACPSPRGSTPAGGPAASWRARSCPLACSTCRMSPRA